VPPSTDTATFRHSHLRQIAAWVAVPATVALLTWAGHTAGANAPTIGFFYMAAVLGLAAWGGQAVGVVASVLAMLCFNFFFLPPLGTLTVEDPANWVALISFLAASSLASRLVATARGQAEAAGQRQREVEVLYELSLGLFAVGQRPGSLGDATARVLQEVGAESGTLFLPDPSGEPLAVSTIGAGDVDALTLQRAWKGGERLETADDGEERTIYLPLLLGRHLAGVLVAHGPDMPPTVLEPAARLLALAVERERLLAESSHLQAVRESDALKTALLRAVSHDLRTPLTAMRLEIESLEPRLAGNPEALAGLHGLEIEQARLSRRIDNLLALARLEAGLARPRPEPTPPGSLFRAARESLSPALAGRELTTRIAPGCPDLLADPSLTVEVLVNLLENAARVSPSNSPLELAAAPDPDTPGRIRLDVLDRGPGIPEAVRRLPATDDLRRHAGTAGDSAAGGLGLRIAASFAAAQGGTLELLDRPGGGTIARITLPAEAGLPEEIA